MSYGVLRCCLSATAVLIVTHYKVFPCLYRHIHKSVYRYADILEATVYFIKEGLRLFARRY